MGIRDTYITVRDAAEVLGVAQNTVRKWGAVGKIPEYRHPANGYRLYKRQELIAFLERIERDAPKRRRPK